MFTKKESKNENPLPVFLATCGVRGALSRSLRGLWEWAVTVTRLSWHSTPRRACLLPSKARSKRNLSGGILEMGKKEGGRGGG